MNKFSRFLSIGSVCALVLSLNLTAQAARRVGGFEAGDQTVTPTNKIGDASAQGTFQGATPFEGIGQYLITTINSADGDALAPVSGTSAVVNSALSSFFHGASPAGVEGSGFYLTFTVNPGDLFLTFNYDFLTNESPAPFHNDTAFVDIFNSANVLQAGSGTLTNATLSQAGLSQLTDQSGPFQFHTGYQPFSISLASYAAGNYTVGFGIQDRTTGDIPSGLLIDNVNITTAAVPEPSTIGLILAGAASFLAVRRRIKK